MSWLDVLATEGERAARLRSDLPYFAEHCLKLRPKTGSLEPFFFNPAQLELHRRIEEQKAKTGRIRVIILKARQLGILTYLSARFFHRCLFNPGLRTFILGHERRASTNLFEMVKRMYEHLPDDVRPATGTFNAETLLFNNDSGYVVSVATPTAPDDRLPLNCCMPQRQHSGRTLRRRPLRCFRSCRTLPDRR